MRVSLPVQRTVPKLDAAFDLLWLKTADKTRLEELGISLLL